MKDVEIIRSVEEKLLEHSRELLKSALHLKIKDEFSPSAITLSAVAIEVLLKWRIFKEDWRLIFRYPEDADIKRLRLGNFQSPSWGRCVKRLSHSCRFTMEKKQKKDIDLLMKYRNKVLHFFDMQDVKPTIEKAFSIWVALIDLWDPEAAMLELESEVESWEEQLQIHWERLKKENDNMENFLECPWCGYKGLEIAVGNEELHCKVCAHSISLDELAFEHDLGSFCKPEDFIAKECEECGHSCIGDLEEKGFVCFYCGVEGLKECDNCCIYGNIDETGMCSSCQNRSL
ncbi:hypothetical protein SCG7109_AJ_00230 [Chlamydiales bacterium SCGC AG-110-M15]|nr:hypothetical protein SCG7109_AJ_00230 [Chlamydiales bacterium SCGC AG-110-M15]